jgi:hypothetical protein
VYVCVCFVCLMYVAANLDTAFPCGHRACCMLFLLLAVYCMLCVVCRLLSVVCFLLPFVRCLLSAVCCLLSAFCCLLSAVCRLLSATCCEIRTLPRCPWVTCAPAISGCACIVYCRGSTVVAADALRFHWWLQRSDTFFFTLYTGVCAAALSACHICREPVTQRIRLF